LASRQSPVPPAPTDLSFLVISHAVVHEDQDVFGPAHNVVEHLNLRGYDVDFVLHSLEGSRPGLDRSFRHGELVGERRLGRRNRAQEVLFNVRRLRSSQANVVVLVDPLNYLPIVVDRHRFRIRVYYTVDYTERRFERAAVNAAYHRLDRLALRHADVIWSVSKRIAARRADQGVSEANNVVVPNAPPIAPSDVVPWSQRRPESVVFVGMIDAIFDSGLFLDALALLAPDRPRLRIRLVGDGPDLGPLTEELGRRRLTQHVELCGYLRHDAALATIATSRVGLALYSGAASWNEYGDSLKVREYLSRGVPVVSTSRHPLATELGERGAGYVVGSPVEAAAAITALLEDEAGVAAERAFTMAEETDRTAVLDRALGDVLLRLRRRQEASGRA
jgi:glycosyltransferase involved in cell wall biosynthesis